MKKLIVFSCLLVVFNCKNDTKKTHTLLSGEIINPHPSKTLTVFNDEGFEKIIQINTDGSFKDTLQINNGVFDFKHGNQYGSMYLSKGGKTELSTNYNNFDKALKFRGDDADFNNLSIASYLITETYFTDDLVNNATELSLDTVYEKYIDGYETLKKTYPNITKDLVQTIDNNVISTANQYKSYVESKIAIRKAFPKGSASPLFEGYQTPEGDKVSLTDFKGSYVYMDIWATWCGPCIVEIPFLKTIEKQFHNKNIKFISISVDDGRAYKGDIEAAKSAWKTMVKEKNLSGVQLISSNGFTSDFIEAYSINSIPRFILIDPNGKIVTADAPRPSSDALLKLLNGLSDL